MERFFCNIISNLNSPEFKILFFSISNEINTNDLNTVIKFIHEV